LKSERESLSFALQNSLDEMEAYREQVAQLREKISSLNNSNNKASPEDSSTSGRSMMIRESPSARSLTQLGEEHDLQIANSNNNNKRSPSISINDFP
jgi:hypothetical protein